MTQLENEIQAIKVEVVSMWTLVESQLNKSRIALLKFDRDLAREVILKEKRVNAFELKLDRDCEDIFALYCPVAIDLRFLLAVLKINTNLERVGDIAEGIAKYVVESSSDFDPSVLAHTGLVNMFDEAIKILTDTRIAFEKEDTILARSIFKRDEALDKINNEGIEKVSECIKENIENMHDALYVLSIIRKLERVGDQSRFRTLLLWPLRHTAPVEREYAPLWTIYQHTRAGANTDDEVLWGLFRHQRRGATAGRNGGCRQVAIGDLAAAPAVHRHLPGNPWDRYCPADCRRDPRPALRIRPECRGGHAARRA